jgi:hypothetical protein
MSLGEVFGQQTTDDPNWQGVTITYWGSADLINGTGPQTGHWVNNHPNGDQDFGTFEGQITTSGGQTTMEGAWQYTGGTGGDIHSPDQIVNAWQGEYEL